MNNYSKALTFFMEHNIQLTNDQISDLQKEFLNEATTNSIKSKVKSDFNKFKKAWSFKTPAIVIKFDEEEYGFDEYDPPYNFAYYDVHDYPAFKKLKSDASRDEVMEVVNKDFYDKFEKAIAKVNKVISGTVEIDGDWDTGNILYKP